MLAIGRQLRDAPGWPIGCGAEIPDWFMIVRPVPMERHLPICSRRHSSHDP